VKTNLICLIIGIILASLGFYQFWQYENNSITVEAIITEIDSREINDDTTDRYEFKYYGNYTVNGKEYKNVQLKKEYSSEMMPDYHTGDKLEIVVNADNPGRKMSEGGFFGTVGLVMIVWNGVILSKAKKTNQAAAE
jgi:hypothetical protein